MQFRNNFINLCKKEDVILDDLAIILNVSKEDILSWEEGEEIPSIHTMQEIARLFNVTVDDLVNVTIPIKSADISIVKRKTKVFSTLLGTAVFTIFLSIGIFLTLTRRLPNYNGIATIILISGILIGIFSIIIPTLNFESYCKKNYIIFKPTKEEVKISKDTFIIKLLIGIITITIGIIQFIIIFINFNNIYTYSLAIMLAMIGLGIGIIIEGGIMMSMYTAPDEVFKI